MSFCYGNVLRHTTILEPFLDWVNRKGDMGNTGFLYETPHRSQFSVNHKYACKTSLPGTARILDNRSLGQCHSGCHQDTISLTPSGPLA